MSDYAPSSLSPATRELLSRLSQGELIERHVALPIASARVRRRVAVAAVFAVGVLALWVTLFFDLQGSSKGYADDDDAMITSVLVALLALPGTVALLGAVSLARSGLRPAVIVGPALVVVTGYDDESVYAVPIGAMGKWSIIDARVRGRVGDRDVVARAPDAAAARRFVEVVEWMAREASALPEPTAAFDWRAGATGPRASSPRLGRFALALTSTLVVALPLTFVIWLAGFARAERDAWALCGERPYCSEYERVADFGVNDVPEFFYAALGIAERRAQVAHRSDDEAWRECQRARSPSSVRGFLTREDSTHLAEARALLGVIYEERSAQLAAEAAALGGDPELIAGIREALRWLATDAESDQMSVGFLPVQGLDGGGIEAEVARLTGSTHVQPVAPSFTAERNAAREHALRDTIATAMRPLAGFATVYPGAAEDVTRPRFSIAVRVAPSGSVYSDRAEERLPPADRTVYPGIVILFDVAVVVPGAATPPRSASIVASPAVDFHVEGTAGAPTAEDVYNRMAETAFDQLEASIERGLGYTPPPPSWLPWVPEWASGTSRPREGGDYVVHDENGGLEWVTAGYRSLLVASGFTVEPFPGALDPAHEWMARLPDHRVRVWIHWDAYQRGTYVRVSDVTGLYP
jgi:hypothetical protein